jgi:hypothetical protein
VIPASALTKCMKSCMTHCIYAAVNPKMRIECAQEEVVARLKETQLLVERFSQVLLPSSDWTRASTKSANSS